MRDLAANAIETARGLRATYADARVVETRDQHCATKNGAVEAVVEAESVGIGIRVLVDGAWGFASTHDLSRRGVEQAARQAVAIARASASALKTPVVLAPTPAVKDRWASPCLVDPFTVSVEAKIGLLLRVDQALRRHKGVTLARGAISCTKTKKFFMNSDGSEIEQLLIQTGAGYSASAFKNGDLQIRSYPTSFGGQHQLRGYELIEELALVENADRIAEEVIRLHRATLCPSKRTALILDSSQLVLQMHESIGHAVELDRVLGFEANYAGTSFLTPRAANRLRYGSAYVNVVSDATLSHGPGLGTFGYDDEGVPAQRTPIIREGMFVGFLTSRETAAAAGHIAQIAKSGQAQRTSGGTMRAEGWNRIPLIRMTNLSLLPGSWRLEDLIADTDDGIYMETNRSWSIDDRRVQFQFGTEIGWEIKKGRKTRMIKNPTYSGRTTEFWQSCDAICSHDYWTLWGVPNCGKGQPAQAMGIGHGASPARFRNIAVGVAYAAR